jgi:hypothetical protein
MIKEFEFYHGLVFARILHSLQRPLSIESYHSPSNASYVISGDVGLYIKYSTKRMTPWRFSFKKEHQEEIAEMRAKYGRVFLVLVCSDDGIVCLSYEELKKILDEHHDPVEWVSAKRQRREMYAIKGSNGVLEFKIGASDFPNKLFTTPQTHS